MDRKTELSALLGGSSHIQTQSTRNTSPLNPENRPITPPPFSFDPIIPPPTHLPLRIPPASPVWAELDGHTSSTVTLPNSPLLEKKSTEAASTSVEKHIKDRTPYVQLASKRLQAALNIRNDFPFTLPQVPKSTVVQGPYSLPASLSSNGTVRSRRKDSGVAIYGGMMNDVMGMHVVDAETGRGLREFLLMKGHEFGGVKKECKSISFHDTTPEMRTKAHQNVLLGHYGMGCAGDRLDVYEVELPKMATNTTTGTEYQASETWLWILIARPIISFDENDFSTFVPHARNSASTISSSQTYSPSPPPSDSHANPGYPIPPPNFPSPLPTSWVVIAVPKSHTTVYPTTTENTSPSTPTHSSRFPSSKPHRNKIQKRADFDFSHSGIPIFEFSSALLFPVTGPLSFLSIERIGSWAEPDVFDAYTESQYAAMRAEHESKNKERNGWTEGEMQGDDAMLGGSKQGVPCPYEGVWWRRYWDEMYEDADRWHKIKRSMGRGRCRVVLRWDGWEGENEDEDEDVELEGMGGIGGVVGGGGGVKKGKGGGKKESRAEAVRRQRSNLVTGDGLLGGERARSGVRKDKAKVVKKR